MTAAITDAAKRTPLYEVHRDLGATFTDFGGWQMPVRYGSEMSEHRAVRGAAGLFDLSHMGEIEVSGRDANRFLDFALVSDISTVRVGRAKYTLLCAADGGVIDDLIVYRLADHQLLVVPNAGNTDAVIDALSYRAAGFDVTVADASARTALLAVQGPAAESILKRLAPAAGEELRALRYYTITELDLSGLDTLVARTGYTGEDGFELFVPAEDAETLWIALELAGSALGLVPCGLAARDSLRLEAGMPLYGNELSRERSPYEAGLSGVVAHSKQRDFVGRAALQETADAGTGQTSGQRLVGLHGTGRRAARSGYTVRRAGADVGRITSGQPSPTLGHPIAMAYVDVEVATPGTELHVDIRGVEEPFVVVPLPFYRRASRA